MPESGHEQRIQNLERELGDSKVEQGKVATSLEFLTAQVDESKSSILGEIKKMSEAFDLRTQAITENFKERTDVLEQKLDGVVAENSIQTQDLETIKKDRAKNAERWQHMRKWAYTGFTAGLAIVVKEIVALIIKHI